MTVLIRRYQVSDIIAVSTIYLQARTLEYASEMDEPGFLPLTRDREIMSLFEQSIIYVFVEDEVVKGFAGYIHDYIGWLYVHPDYHRQHVGQRLLEHMLQALDGKPLKLSLLQSNHAARLCYERFGFRQTETFQFEYQGRQMSGIRMLRPFPLSAATA